MKGLLLFTSLLCLQLFAAPPTTIPEHLVDAFLMEGQVGYSSYYFDGSRPSDKPLVYDIESVENLISKALRRENSYYGPTDHFLYSALDKYIDHIKGKKIGILGSTIPWYEAIILSYGGIPVTIDYNAIISEHPSIRTLTVDEYSQNPETFDAILSISSFEHDGLGRYGEPINPNGDLEAMEKTKHMLKPGGILFLAVPTGLDYIFWNAHRVYGKARLPLLLQGWKNLDTVGGLFLDSYSNGYHQPVLVLTPNL